MSGMVFIASACTLNLGKNEPGGKVEVEQVLINGEYSMDIATYMTKTNQLNDDASLQFQNIFKEAYIIVIDEDAKEFVDVYTGLEAYDSTRSVLSNYADTQVQLLSSGMEVLEKDPIQGTKINGLNAATTRIDGKVDGIESPISYYVTFVDGKEKVYMIMAWTLQNRKEAHKAAFEQMASSFKLLKPARKEKVVL